MAKAPIVGQVKTRLADAVGPVEAARFYRVMSRTVIARLGADRRWSTRVSVTPDSFSELNAWPRHFPRMRQQGGDLGRRMQHIFNSLPPGPVLIAGTDIPSITPFHIKQAFDLLGRNDVVFGPAGDGGFWLVGCRRVPRVPRIFSGVRWSTSHALADTIANTEHLKVGLCATLDDIDDLAGYRLWRSRAPRRVQTILCGASDAR